MPRQHTTDDPTYRRNRQLLLESNPPCHWCNTPNATTADHLIELDRGGDSSLSNLVPACHKCNSKRGALYKARRDAIRQQNRPHAGPNPLFTQNTPPPTPCNSVSFENQPETAKTGQNETMPTGIGHDQPRLETPLPAGASYGPLVATWAKENQNVDLFPWQVHALTGQLMHDDAGDLIFRESLVSSARQNGKSTALAALIGFWLTDYAKLRGPQQVLSTANKLDRAEAIFTQLAPVLVERFGAKALNAVGRKELRLPDGSAWFVRAASPALHGGSYSLIVVDEIWNIGPHVVDDALLPSMVAQRSPLMSCWSTAGDESSEVMIRQRSLALAEIDAGRRGLCYFAEWSLPPGADWKDPNLWGYANPSLGRTITLPALQAAAKKDSFARAHLNLWVSARGAWLENGVWESCKTDDQIPAGAPAVLAIDSSLDESRYVGVRAALVDDRVICQLEFVTESESDLWDQVAGVMADNKTRLAVTPTLEIHVPEKYRHADRFTIVGYAELLKYTALVRSMINEGRVAHTGQQTLAEHMNRATLVKTSQGAALSSQRSPGPIEAARTAVWAIALVSRPQTRQKPLLVIAGR